MTGKWNRAIVLALALWFVHAHAASTVDVSRPSTSLPASAPPAKPAVPPARAAVVPPNITIIDPPEGATRTARNLRVRIAVSGISDLSRKVILSLYYACPPAQGACVLQQVATLKSLVAGYAPQYDPQALVSLSDALPVRLEVSPDPRADWTCGDAPCAQTVNVAFNASVRFQIVLDPATARMYGGGTPQNASNARQPAPGFALDTPPTRSMVTAAGAGSSNALRPSAAPAAAETSSTSAARPAPPKASAVLGAGSTGAAMKIVEPAPSSTSSPYGTRLRVTYGAIADYHMADVELTWQELAPKTGPTNTALVRRQATNTFQVPLQKLAAGIDIDPTKVCNCPEQQVTVKVRPSGASQWYDSVVFSMSYRVGAGSSGSPSNAWSQVTPAQGTSAPSTANALRAPAAVAPGAQVPGSALGPR